MRFRKNSLSIMVLLSLFLTCFLGITSSCNTLKGHNGVSADIEESKKRGVFISEYQALQNPYIINDSLKINVKSAWLEKRWKYPENLNETILVEGYQLIIITKKKDISGFGQTWRIGLDGDRYFRVCGEECIITDFKEAPKEEKEIWQVQKGAELYDGAEHLIIGKFVLDKKKE